MLILSVWNDVEGGCEEFDGLRDFWLGQFLGAGRVRLWEVYSWIGARDTLISSFRFLLLFSWMCGTFCTTWSFAGT